MIHRIYGLLGLVFALSACDPCAGMLACGDARVLMEGDVVWHFNRQPAEGTVVRFERTTGVRLESDTLVAHVDGDGRFVLRAAADRPGAVHGRLVFLPGPPFQSLAFAQPDLTLLATAAPDQPRFLGSWGVGPLQISERIRYYGTLSHRGDGTPVAGATIEVERVGGIRVDPELFTTESGENGRFDIDLGMLEPGEVIVDIRVFPPAPADSFSARGVELGSPPEPDQPRLLAHWAVGEHVSYAGELQWGNGGLAGDVEVEFRFTEPAGRTPIRTHTGADGRFYIRPVTQGPVVFTGDLVVRPGTARERLLADGLQLPSFAEDAPRFLRIWWIDP